MKINAAVIAEQSGDFIIETLKLREPYSDEVLMRIVASGICHTDLAARDGLCQSRHRQASSGMKAAAWLKR